MAKKSVIFACMAVLLIACFGCTKTQQPDNQSSEGVQVVSNQGNQSSESSSEPVSQQSDPSQPSQSSEQTVSVPDQPPVQTGQTQIFTQDSLQYEIPADWTEVSEMSDPSKGIYFFTRSDIDVNTQPSNVVVEVVKQSTSDVDGIDYSDVEMQQSFREYFEQMVLPTKTGHSNFNFSVEQINGTYVYIPEMDRDTGDGKTVHQTYYYPMGLGYSVIVYATDFQDGISPDVKSVAKQIISTFQVIGE